MYRRSVDKGVDKTMIDKVYKIVKLLALTTEEKARKLCRHISIESHVKSDNWFEYYSIDVINTVIDMRRKSSFLYTDFDINKNLKWSISDFGMKQTLVSKRIIPN